MNCDTCLYKETCKTRNAPGKHREVECDMYFPNLSDRKVRGPRKIRTPEDRQEEIETRDET